MVDQLLIVARVGLAGRAQPQHRQDDSVAALSVVPGVVPVRIVAPPRADE